MTKQERELVSGGLCRHFKGKLYNVCGIAENASTGKKMVCYQAMYPPYKHYVRDYDEFVSEVDREKYPDANQKYRFELLDGEI